MPGKEATASASTDRSVDEETQALIDGFAMDPGRGIDCVCIVADGTTIQASKAILIRTSCVFEAMLADAEGDEKEELPVVCSPRAFVRLLQLIYPDHEVELSAELVVEVFPLAHMYDMRALVNLCISWANDQRLSSSSQNITAVILIDSLICDLVWKGHMYKKLAKALLREGVIGEAYLSQLRPATVARMLKACAEDKSLLAPCFGLKGGEYLNGNGQVKPLKVGDYFTGGRVLQMGQGKRYIHQRTFHCGHEWGSVKEAAC